MISLIVGTISLATVFLFGCIGEIITEKAGHLNLGIPGIMCMGTAGGCWGVSLYMSVFASNPSWILLVLTALIFAGLFGAIAGGIYAVLTISLHCNQNITGLAVTTFGAGFTQFFIDTYVDRSNFDAASKLISKGLPFADKLGWFGEVFLSYGIFVYLGIVVAILVTLFLGKTRAGLHLRAIGENPATADAAGVNVTAYKYVAILVGSAIAGLGGMFYIMDYIGGSWENAYTIEALGWLSVALVIFSMWKPHFSIIGSIIFACFYILAFKITGVTFTQMALLKLLPYVVTIVVLIVTSVIGSKAVQPPAALGQNYFREER